MKEKVILYTVEWRETLPFARLQSEIMKIKLNGAERSQGGKSVKNLRKKEQHEVTS